MKDKKFSSYYIAYMAFFITLSIVLRRILKFPLPVIGDFFTFGGFPIILSGIILGPSSGGIVGAVSDVLGFPLAAKGVYLPHFTVTAALAGIIPSLILKLSGFSSDKIPPYWLMVLAIFTGQLITGVILVSYFLHVLLGYPLWVMMAQRFIIEIFHSFIYASLSIPIMRVFKARGWKV